MSNEICEAHGRLRCSECAYVEELKEEIESLRAELAEQQEISHNFHRMPNEYLRQRDEVRQALEDMRSAKEAYRNESLKWHRIAVERRQANAALLALIRRIAKGYEGVAENLIAQYDTAQPTAQGEDKPDGS